MKDHRLNIDALNYDGQNNVQNNCELIDVQSVICRRLLECGVSEGNVIIADTSVEYEAPSVFVSESSLVGNISEGFWETIVVITCVTNTDYDALRIAHQVIEALDGWGGYGIEDVSHQSTIPIRMTDYTPVLSKRVLTFRVIHQERKK